MVAMDEIKFNRLLTFLKYVYGSVVIIIGLDKFSYCIVNWDIYVSPLIPLYLPTFISYNIVQIVGIIEITAGAIILSPYTRLGAYLVAAFLGLIILNLLTIKNMYDIALRDIVILIGFVTFGILMEIKKNVQQS